MLATLGENLVRSDASALEELLDRKIDGPICLQAEHSCSKICNTSSLSSQRGIQRFAPGLVTVIHALTQPVLESLTSSFGKTSSVKGKRYVLSSTPTGPSSPGFKECSSFQLPTTSCRHRICVSDRTIQASSSLSSIERCNCGQWSSTVCEGCSPSSLCASRDSRCPLANSLVFIPGMPAHHLFRYQTLQQEAPRHVARASG